MQITGDVAAQASHSALSKAQTSAGVSLQKKSGEQQEAVVGKLLEGIKAQPSRSPEQSGQNLNVKV